MEKTKPTDYLMVPHNLPTNTMPGESRYLCDCPICSLEKDCLKTTVEDIEDKKRNS